MGLRDRDDWDDTNPSCGYSNYNGYSGTQVGFNRSNPNVTRVDIDKKIPAIALLIRNFRENGVFTIDSYKHLLQRLCRACGIPDYRPNRPIYVLDPECSPNYAYAQEEKKTCRAKYVKGKELHIREIDDLPAFIGCFYIYLRKRNEGFSYDNDETVLLKGQAQEVLFMKEVMKSSRPQVIRRFESRAFIREITL